jgi:hypothetical protein
MKRCKKCQVDKPLSEFYVLKRGHAGRVTPGHFSECKDCNRARGRESMRKLRAADPDYAWRRHLMCLYGITPEDYCRLLEAQGGCCAVCGSQEAGGRGKRFHVDHDHETGQVRGLLCHACNTGLGALGEDVTRLMAAAAYLLERQDVLEAVVF